MNLQNELAFIDESRRWRSGAPVGRVDSSNDIISNVHVQMNQKMFCSFS